MPWYAWLYVVYLAAITAVAAFEDVKDHEKMWRIILDITTGALQVGFVLAWYRGVPAILENLVLPVLFLLSVFWFAQEGVHVAKHHTWENDDTPTERFIFFTVGSVLAVMSALPAVVAGAILSYRVFTK